MTEYILALDQGTTSSRAVVFDKKGKEIGMLSAIPFEAYEYYRSDKTSQYLVYTFDEILKTFGR